MSLADTSELSSGKRKKAIRSTVDGLVSVLKVLKAGTSEACPPAATVADLLIMVCEAFKVRAIVQLRDETAGLTLTDIMRQRRSNQGAAIPHI